MLSKILLKLGFNKKEADIYLCLLKRGSLSSSSIAKYTQLNRSTCYTILDKLLQKRIIHQYIKNNLKHYKANPPQQIRHLFQAEEEQLFLKRKFFKETLPLLNSVINQNKSSDPKMKLYQGIQGIKTTYEDSLTSPGEILSIKSINYMPKELYGFIFNEFIPKRIKKKISARVLTNQSTESSNFQLKDQSQLRQTKIISQEVLDFPIEINIYKDKCSFILFSRQKFLSLIIENPEISNSLKVLFELLWLNY